MKARVLASAVVVAALLGPLLTGGSVADAASETSSGEARVAPLVVVLDLSGSMNEDDGAGRIKLSGAKRAVDDTIRDLATNQDFGVWTYPGGHDSCSSGAFAIAPGPVSDKTGAIATVDGLTADGGTPTGPALESVAASLTAMGTSSATLVLVSDGESNCGESPCIVAANLLAEGFTVTIHAVGFRVSDAGREELNCVASTTGGTYVDAEDSDQLNQTLRELTRAKLRVQAGETAATIAGGSARVVVTLSNTSNVTVSDARILLKAEGKGTAGASQLLRVGNLPPAAIITRTWVIGLSSALTSLGEVGAAESSRQGFTVSAWANNADRVSVTGALGEPMADSGAASMRQYLGSWLREPLEKGHPIVIMGDSYSSGEGAYGYVQTEDVSPGCHRSTNTYLVPQLDPGDVINLACSGAVTWDFSRAGRDGTPPQLEQLEALEQAPSVVIMTLGGNDLGFKSIIEQCVLASCDADAELHAARLQIADWMRTWLEPVYEDVWITLNTADRIAQRGGDTAPVIVLAYPQVTHATQYGACGAIQATGGVKGTFGAGEVAVANQLAARLNAAVKAAVADARSAGFEVYFVPDTADLAQPNHTLCDADGFINDIVGFGAAESVHPNVAGYAAESGIIINWTASIDRQRGSRTVGAIDQRNGESERWRLFPERPAEPASTGVVISGDSFLVEGADFDPGSPVFVMMHSTPVLLATLVADESGAIRGEVPVPGRLELGAHEVVLYGVTDGGGYREEHLPVTVLAAPPPWVQLALPAAGALLVAAGVFTVLWWRGRRRRPAARPGPGLQPES